MRFFTEVESDFMHKIKITIKTIVEGCLLILFLTGCDSEISDRHEPTGGNEVSANHKAVLRYTAIPDQNTTELAEKFAPLTQYLSAQLNLDVEYIPSRDYQASVEMFKSGDVLLAWFGGLTGVQARKAIPGARAIAQGKEDASYLSYFIAHRDTGLTLSEQFPDAIAAHRFTFGSESSTSGRLMPEYFIRQNTGKSPEEFFQQNYAFSGSHDKTVALVEAGSFEVGVVNYQVYDQRVAQGLTDPELVRIIWRTPAYADYNWTAHPDLDKLFGDDFTQRLKDILVTLEDKELLSALGRTRLISASNEDYEGILKVAQELEMVR